MLTHACRCYRRSFAGLPYLSFCACLMGWCVCETLSYIPDSRAAVAASLLEPAFSAFLPVCLLLAVAGYYRLNRVLPGWFPAAACAVPAAACVLALLDTFNFMSFQVPAINRLTWQCGTLTVYGLLLALTAAFFLIFCQFTLPGAYRGGLFLLFAGTAGYICGSLLLLFEGERAALDYSLVGAGICGVFLHFALMTGGRASYLHIERDEAFHYLDEAVYILNGDGVAADCNRPVAPFGDTKDDIPFDRRFGGLVAEGRVIRKGADHRGYEDLYIQDGRFGAMYEMYWRQKSMERPHCGFVILSDVTNNRLFIERLRETAGFDSLTGLPNRYRYLHLMRELDHENALPLSIVMGDVNGLKKVNDTHGHAKGDQLLKAVADVLKGCCPENGHVARLSGDEFMMLLPVCTGLQAQLVMQKVQSAAACAVADELRPSIALGCATKSSMDENINFLIEEADRKMYSDKLGTRMLSKR